MKLGIPEDMLTDVRLLFGLSETDSNSGKGPFTSLKNKSTKIPPQGEISSIDIFTNSVLQDLKRVEHSLK